MSSCCSSTPSTLLKPSTEAKPPKRHTCPADGKEYSQVPLSTILLHIKKPWTAKYQDLTEQGYYFCTDPDCDVIYFSEKISDNNGVVISKSELRTIVGIKEPKNKKALSCYCFDITHKEAGDNPDIKQYVIDKTKNGFCACESLNPSGRCCLKDFPKFNS